MLRERKKTWLEVFNEVLREKVHTDLIYSTNLLDCTIDELYSRYQPYVKRIDKSIGDYDGQIADYRITLKDDVRSIHVKVYPTFYKVHWDYVDPKDNPLMHLLLDAPHWFERVIDIVSTVLKTK